MGYLRRSFDLCRNLNPLQLLIASQKPTYPRACLRPGVVEILSLREALRFA